MSDNGRSGNSYCKHCGAEINKDAPFCKKCGKSIKSEIIYVTFWDSIEWRDIIESSVLASLISIFFIILTFFTDLISGDLFFLLYLLITTVSSGVYVGYKIWGDAKKIILNGAIAGVLTLTLITLISFLLVVVGLSFLIYYYLILFLGYILIYSFGLIILALFFGSLGGIIGLLIKKIVKRDPNEHYAIGIVVVVSVLIFMGGCAIQLIFDSQSNHFDNTYVAFDYPNSWLVYQNSSSQTSNSITLASVRKIPGYVMFIIDRQNVPSGWSVESYVNEVQKNVTDVSDQKLINQSNQLLSNQSINFNGMKGYDFIYEVKDGAITYKTRVLWIDKSPYVYTIGFIAPIDQYDLEQHNFNLILKSLTIK